MSSPIGLYCIFLPFSIGHHVLFIDLKSTVEEKELTVCGEAVKSVLNLNDFERSFLFSLSFNPFKIQS